MCPWHFSWPLRSRGDTDTLVSILVSYLLRQLEDSGQHMYWAIRVVTDISHHVFPLWIVLGYKKNEHFICDHPLEILWPFHRFWSILSLHISMSRGKRGREWLRTALYTFLALYTICYTSPLLNCYTQYSYHSLWVFIKICLTINAVLVQNNCFSRHTNMVLVHIWQRL